MSRHPPSPLGIGPIGRARDHVGKASRLQQTHALPSCLSCDGADGPRAPWRRLCTYVNPSEPPPLSPEAAALAAAARPPCAVLLRDMSAALKMDVPAGIPYMEWCRVQTLPHEMSTGPKLHAHLSPYHRGHRTLAAHMMSNQPHPRPRPAHPPPKFIPT
jgi:hypothetical protein